MRFILFILIFFTIASPLSADDSVSVKKLLLEKMKEANYTDKQKDELKVIVARELMPLKKYDQALELYLQSLNSKYLESFSEAYNNILFIYLKKNNQSKFQEFFSLAQSYWSTSSNRKDKKLLEFWKGVSGKKFDKSKVPPVAMYFFVQRDLKKLIENKKYSEALFSLGTGPKDGSAYVTLVLYDLLRTLVVKKVSNFRCEKKLKQYPHSQAFTIQICKKLIAYQKGERLTQKDLKEIKAEINLESPRRLYWLTMLKELL